MSVLYSCLNLFWTCICVGQKEKNVCAEASLAFKINPLNSDQLWVHTVFLWNINTVKYSTTSLCLWKNYVSLNMTVVIFGTESKSNTKAVCECVSVCRFNTSWATCSTVKVQYEEVEFNPFLEAEVCVFACVCVHVWMEFRWVSYICRAF